MKTKKIIWAVDVFQETDLTQNTVQNLLTFANETGSKIEPVSILNPSIFLYADRFDGIKLDPLKKVFTQTLQVFCKKYLEEKYLKPVVLVSKQGSIRESVELLLNYAKMTKADFICLSTHARHGMNRGILGSFAETCCHLSKIPLFIINPKSTKKYEFKKILFPTTGNKEDVQQALTLQKNLVNKNSLFRLLHILPRPFENAVQQSTLLLGGTKVDLGKIQELALPSAVKKMKSFQKILTIQKIECETEIDRNSESIPKGILAAQKNSDLIVLITQNGSIKNKLIGSRTIQVIRQSETPILYLPKGK